MAKTKIDLLVDRLIELTNGDYLAWTHQSHEKYNYVTEVYCTVPGGKIVLPMESLSDNVLAVESTDGSVSLFTPPGLDDLKRAIQEHHKLDLNWETQKIVDAILEGEIENGDKGTEQGCISNQEGQEGQESNGG